MKPLHRPSVFAAVLCQLLLLVVSHAQSTKDVPAERFQGTWTVKKHYFRTLMEGAVDLDSLGEESAEGTFPSQEVIRFRRHESGAIQRIWTDDSGEVARSKGIEVLEVTPTRLVYRAWSDHPTWKTIITIGEDGSAVYQVRSPKHQDTAILIKAEGRDVSAQQTKGESGGGDRIAPVTPPTPPGMRLRTGRFQSD